MKYKIDRIRERTVTEEGTEKEIIRVWYSSAEVDYHGYMDFAKKKFRAADAKKAIELQLKEIEKFRPVME